jgi:hypothetical protein
MLDESTTESQGTVELDVLVDVPPSETTGMTQTES